MISFRVVARACGGNGVRRLCRPIGQTATGRPAGRPTSLPPAARGASRGGLGRLKRNPGRNGAAGSLPDPRRVRDAPLHREPARCGVRERARVASFGVARRRLPIVPPLPIFRGEGSGVRGRSERSGCRPIMRTGSPHPRPPPKGERRRRDGSAETIAQLQNARAEDRTAGHVERPRLAGELHKPSAARGASRGPSTWPKAGRPRLAPSGCRSARRRKALPCNRLRPVLQFPARLGLPIIDADGSFAPGSPSPFDFIVFRVPAAGSHPVAGAVRGTGRALA